MRIYDLEDKRIVIWGPGREGLAAAAWLVDVVPNYTPIFVAESGAETASVGDKEYPVYLGEAAIAQQLAAADVLIKSPGVSLYHPLLDAPKKRGLVVTSLLNLWLAEVKDATVIGVTGTKGKSTTSTLLGHVLNALGKRALVVGNIGTPVTEARPRPGDTVIIETSSYQAANFDGRCDIGVLTSLYPEHLTWHGELETYYTDKLNLLAHSDLQIVEAKAYASFPPGVDPEGKRVFFATLEGWHFAGDEVFKGSQSFGALSNRFLNRVHNRGNVCAVLTVIENLGLDPAAALAAMDSYRGLPHRQYELGEKDGLLFVDDGLSTTPQSAMAALEAYRDQPTALIVGGFDRGIDFSPIIEELTARPPQRIVCLGSSGKLIHRALNDAHIANAFLAATMEDAVSLAKRDMPPGGVVLLSPGAPSFDMFKDYKDRSSAFARAAGFEDLAP